MVESIKLSDVSIPLQDRVSLKPEQVASPLPFGSIAADPEFLPVISDRSNLPLEGLTDQQVDLSKLNSAIDKEKVSRLVYERLLQSDSKLFRLVKYP